MSQVKAKAAAYVPPNRHQSLTHSSVISPPVPPGASPESRTALLVALMLAAAAGSLVLATRAPLATTVLGLIAFGVLHNVLEIRYVAGRFAGLLTGRFLVLLLALISGIVVCRVAATVWPGPARTSEVVLGFVILAVGCQLGLRGGWLLLGWSLLAVGGTVAVLMPAYYFVILTHLHNLVPLVFLWEWASRLPRAGDRWAFRTTQVLWILVVPLLILFGALDGWLSAAPGVADAFVGDGSRVVATAAPPDVFAQLGLRFLVVFAFMQTMHYVVWVAFLPRFAPEAVAAFDARVPWLRGWRAWVLGLAGGALLATLFLSDYFAGRALYAALATYHAYLEFPVLLALLLGSAATRERSEQITQPSRAR